MSSQVHLESGEPDPAAALGNLDQARALMSRAAPERGDFGFVDSAGAAEARPTGDLPRNDDRDGAVVWDLNGPRQPGLEELPLQKR